MAEVSLYDPEGDSISLISWEVVEAPPGSTYYLESDGPQLLFSADDPGLYWIELTAADQWGATSTTSFPVPVTLVLEPEQCGPDGLCIDSLCDDGDPCTVDDCAAGLCENSTLDEVCDGVDNDCDGSADEKCLCPVTADVTGVATVTVADVVCMILTTLWSFTGEVGPPPTCLGGNDPTAADVNCDGSISIPDIQLAITVALGNPLPAAVDPNGNGCSDACEPNPCGNGVCEPEESALTCTVDCP